ncbi:MAG TPA: guanylate kinase [Thermoanaerobaculia bacterium]|nr:guanylate kinase [Thermoanaerobaculia bacterium]
MSETMQRGELFIISAPSGAGKTTLIRNLLSSAPGAGLTFSISHTTRRPRGVEVNGREYHFVDHATFREMIAADRFLEWAEVHGNFYGTSYDAVLPRLEQGIDVLLDIDVQGAEKVLTRHPEAHSIFVLPPSYEALERRLHQRGLDDPEQIARRLAVSLSEIGCYERYRYVILNDDVRQASQALASIVLEKRHRRERVLPRIQSILNDFQERAAALRF